jgi:DNA repair ATPase RecN
MNTSKFDEFYDFFTILSDASKYKAQVAELKSATEQYKKALEELTQGQNFDRFVNSQNQIFDKLSTDLQNKADQFTKRQQAWDLQYKKQVDYINEREEDLRELALKGERSFAEADAIRASIAPSMAAFVIREKQISDAEADLAKRKQEVEDKAERIKSLVG